VPPREHDFGFTNGQPVAVRHQSSASVPVRAHIQPLTSHDEEATARLLVERSRIAFWIVLAALAVLWATDATFNRDVVVPLTLITLGQATMVGFGFVALARVRSRRAAASIPVLVLGGILASGVVSDLISSNPQGVGLSALVNVMVSATLMPWGVWFQTAMVVVSAVAGALSVWLVTGSVSTLGYAAGPGMIVMLASISVAHAFERARRERFRVETELRFLQMVSLEVGAAADPDAALTIVLQRVCEASGWTLGQAWTLAADAQTLECTARWPADDDDDLTAFHAESERLRFVAGEGLPGRVWASERATWVADVQCDANFPRSAAAKQVGLVAGMGIPVLADGAVIAVLEFFVRERHGEDGRLIALFAGAATQLGAVIKRKRAEQALARSKHSADAEAQISAALVEVARTLSTHLGRPDMLEHMSRVAAGALACDWSAVFMADETQSVLRLVAGAGLGPELRAMLAATPLPAEGMLSAGGEPIEVQDARIETAGGPPLLRRLQAAAVLATPLRLGDAPIGMQVHGYRERVGGFSARQRRLALGVADATAIAVANARLIDDLQASSQLKSEFVATMSHELRTPLNIIVGYSDMLNEGVGGDLGQEQRDIVTRIQRAGVELLDLVNATLDLGRLEAGRDAVSRDIVDLDALLHQLDAELLPLVAPGVALRWHNLLADAPLVTDKTKLKTVLKNLVGNALKFTTAGSVDVTARWAGERVSLAVRDTGIGIPAESLPVIFEMFRQADASSTRTFGGVGLGLHIVRRLVDLLGGDVTVESQVGVGSTFTASWPTLRAAHRSTGT
jgi:signal transduction histidine kinase